nr:flagellar biosynthesis anti-sigma factor FlgM [Campylobacter sp.]
MVNSVGASRAFSSEVVKSNAKVRPTQVDTGEQNKLSEIAKKVEDGSYKVNLDSLAKKIAEELA